MFRIATQYKPDSATAGALCCIWNGLRQELIVPQIGMGIERHRREKNYDRLLKNVRSFDGHVQRRVVESTLRSLHPVNNAAALRFRIARAPHRDAWIGSQVIEYFHSESCPA